MAEGLYKPEPRFRWPGGTRCAAMISFDVDGETTLLSEGEEFADRMTTMSQCTYGPRVGVPRLLGLLEHHGVAATFFVPSYVAERHPEMMAAIVDAGHEVGAHGHLHEKLAGLTQAEERSILDKSCGILERLTGRQPRGFRAPWFELNPWTVDLLGEFGIDYCSSQMGDDVPFLNPNGVVEIPVQWMLEDWEQFAFNADPAWGVIPEDCGKVFDLWWDEFEGMWEYGCCFVLTLHPWLSGRPSRVRLLERLLVAMRERGGVWFAKGGEICDWVKANPGARREVDFDATAGGVP